MKPPMINQRMEKRTSSQFTPPEHTYFQAFPTTMVSGFLDLDLTQIANDIRNLIDKNKEKEDDIYQNYTTYFNQELRDETERLPWYNDFANAMKDMYILFLKEQYHREVDHLSRHDIHFFPWVNLYSKDNYHEAHNHVRSVLSGTWYIKIPKTAGAITFHNPGMETVFSHNTNDSMVPHPDVPNVNVLGSTGSQTQLVCKPEEGQFLMWPAYMLHSIAAGDWTDPNYERICISFNLSHNDPLDHTTCGDDMSYNFMR
jgi:uncharacterized protein (TIGR02466 family)